MRLTWSGNSAVLVAAVAVLFAVVVAMPFVVAILVTLEGDRVDVSVGNRRWSQSGCRPPP